MRLYKAKLKSRKQIMVEIPREQQGWWVDVCAGQTLTLRDATPADLARCSINDGQTRDPADYLCEACERGSLVRRIAIKDLVEIPDRRTTPPLPGTARLDDLMKYPSPHGTLVRLADVKCWIICVEREGESSTAPTDEAGERAAFEAWWLGQIKGNLGIDIGADQKYWAKAGCRAALASRPVVEAGEQPPLPAPSRMIRLKDDLDYPLDQGCYTADQMRAYGQECVCTALAAKPAKEKP